MNSEVLVEKLNFPRAYHKTRLDITQWVINHPETFPELVAICFKTDNKNSYKAAWILELVCAEKLEMLLPYLDIFLKNIPKAKKDQAVRPFSKICLMLTKHYYLKKNVLVVKNLKPKYKQTITECCFDWLISNQKVATEAYAMQSLYFLGTEFNWVHPELSIIIKQNIPTKSAAYKARGRMTLEEIEKFQKKKP